MALKLLYTSSVRLIVEDRVSSTKEIVMKKSLITLVVAAFAMTSVAFAAETTTPANHSAKSVVVKKAKKKKKKTKKAKKAAAEAPAAEAPAAAPAGDAGAAH
jgi:hypothetical protein